MKTIGLIGGMSWESTALYYKLLNQEVKDRLGGLNSAQVLIYSLNFEDVEPYQREGEWLVASNKMLEAAKSLERAGADCLLICSVTGHEGFDYIKKQVSIPMIHIAKAVNSELVGIDKVGLLGTIYTMDKNYFKKKIKAKVIVPNGKDKKWINEVIYEELCKGTINSNKHYKNVISKLINRGAQAIILGCTELPLLIKSKDVLVPVFDSVKLHCKSAVDFALN